MTITLELLDSIAEMKRHLIHLGEHVIAANSHRDYLVIELAKLTKEIEKCHKKP